jgi:hypothetical protein
MEKQQDAEKEKMRRHEDEHNILLRSFENLVYKMICHTRESFSQNTSKYDVSWLKHTQEAASA